MNEALEKDVARDTGEAFRDEVLRRLAAIEALSQDAARRERERDERSSQVWLALKQSVLQFLALIGRK